MIFQMGVARPTLHCMRTSALCVSVLVVGCSSGSTTAPQTTGANKGKSHTSSAGLTRELLQRRKVAVSFGDSPAPALRSDSVYATIALGVDHGCLVASSGAFADQRAHLRVDGGRRRVVLGQQLERTARRGSREGARIDNGRPRAARRWGRLLAARGRW